jgi:hypothetical protein
MTTPSDLTDKGVLRAPPACIAAATTQVRQIDCVTVKGSCQPLGLFCYDLDLAAAEVQLAALNEHGVPSATSSCPGGACVNSHTSSARSLLSPTTAGDAVSTLQQDSGGSSTNSSMNTVGRVRHSLAVMPGAASAARSSVVVSAGHTSRGHEEQGHAGVDPAEVSSRLYKPVLWQLSLALRSL